MRAFRFLAITLLAIVALAGCKDSAPTSTTSSTSATSVQATRDGNHSPSPSGGTVVIPTAGGFVSQALSRGNFPDDIDITFRLKLHHGTTVVHVNDPSQVVMAKITIPPNSTLPWHTHPGPAIVSVLSGQLSVVDGEGCTLHEYDAGKAFVDPGNGHVHIGFNSTDVETVVYVTYLDVPALHSPLVPVANPGC